MNISQVARQIKNLLQARKWTGSSTTVFDSGSVMIVSADSDVNALDAGLIMPLALVVPGEGQSDPTHGEEPDLIEQDVSVVLVAMNENDRLGEAALLGAVRVGTTDSRGRGVLELEAELFATIKKLSNESGIWITFAGQGASAIRRDQDDVPYAIQEYRFRAHCTANLFFPPARKFAASEKTGEIDLTWALPPARYDFYRVRLVRKSGSTAPTSVTDGTVVTSTASGTSYADTGLAVGTYSYSLFASYDDFSATPAEDLRYSDPVSITSVQAF